MTEPRTIDDPLPPSLAVVPNIPWQMQTLEQLRAERDYWCRFRDAASGAASRNAAEAFRRTCERWIARHEAEAPGDR